MKKRWIGCAVWLLMTAGLYFFENNSGTRAILICSLLFPLLPLFRVSLMGKGITIRKGAGRRQTVKNFQRREGEEPGDVRPYQPGDPVSRIHWKLSAKKDEPLIRENEAEPENHETERAEDTVSPARRRKWRKCALWICLSAMLLCALSLALIPEAKKGTMAICNRVFAASEAVNAYAYDYFPVSKDQSIIFAAVLITAVFLTLVAITLLLRSGTMTMILMTAVTFFQVYFGLSLPGWANILLYGAAGLWMIHLPRDCRSTLSFMALILIICLMVAALYPGVDPGTEAASERARDQISRMARQMTGTVREQPEGESETRHTHTQSLQTGTNQGRTGREYRLVTLEEEQISMPRFINWVRTIFMILLSAGLIVLPFAPFMLLNARKKKAEEARKDFDSPNVSEAVGTIFHHVILWLSETGHDAGNLLYRDWTETLPPGMPEGYADRFRSCAGDFEEAVYSSHVLAEEKRQRALELLKETEEALFHTADWKQRLRIRYWVCLRE